MNVLFHLSFPVENLNIAKQFYVEVLGCSVGREKDGWLDVYFFGHQLTLHELPEQVWPIENHGVRHFGATLSWDDWIKVTNKLKRLNISTSLGPKVTFKKEPKEQGKVFFRDPSGNGIELKAYKNPRLALSLPEEVEIPF